MYERSAIVLEKYVEKMLEFNKQYNLKSNYERYKNLIDEVENYQIITTKENEIIKEFDETVKELEKIQKEQEKLYKANVKLEEDRNKLFYDLGENANTLENKFQKIESNMEKNNEQLKQLRVEFIKYLSDFTLRQKERNKCEKERRLAEANHIEFLKKATSDFDLIDSKDLLKLKEFMNSQKVEEKQELCDIMIKNGKNEKVGFNKEVLKLAIDTRMQIAEREAQCYMIVYDKTRRILAEIENDNLKLEKYKKALKDNTVKIAFLEAEKEYIVGMLDYERMTALSGVKLHNKLMEEACKNFESDIVQIENLYELILREIANKATKKAYKELYNKTYLKNIEDKEKNFEEEVNSIKINMGTVINSNYWRIEGIKNVYDVFQKEVSEKFEKDLSEFRIEETEKNIKTDEIEKQEEPSSEKQTKAKKAIKIGGKEKKDSKAEEEKNKFIDDIFEDMDLNEKEFEEDYEDDDEDDYDEEDYEYNNNEEEKEDFIEDDYEFFEEDEEDEDDEDDFLDDEDDENIFDDDLEEDYEDDDEEEDDDDFFDDEDFLNDEENEDTDEEDFFDIDEENDEDEDFDIDEEDEDDLNIYEIDIDDDDIEKNNEKDFLDNYNEFIGNKKSKKKAEEKEKNKKAQKETKSKSITKKDGTVLRKSARGRKKKEIKEEEQEKQENKILDKIFKDKKVKAKK